MNKEVMTYKTDTFSQVVSIAMYKTAAKWILQIKQHNSHWTTPAEIHVPVENLV